MRIHQDDPTLILMSIPYGMSYDAGLHTLEQPRIRQWLKNYEKKQITLPTTEDRLEKERQKRLHAEEYRQKLLAVIPGNVSEMGTDPGDSKCQSYDPTYSFPVG